MRTGDHATRLVVASAALTAAWLFAYAPTIRGGFIKDDFAWVYHSRIDGWSSVYAAFAQADGFYRPVVHLSFGLTEALFGADPVPYGLTNLLLALACAVAIAALARELTMPPWAALVAAGTWAFNFHGINMAVVWLSGRTSLFGTLFSTLAAWCLAKQHRYLAALLAFAAFMSKEEVLALPFVCAAWLLIDRRRLTPVVPMFAALLVYLVLRDRSGAFGISNAPPFYQFTTDPGHIAKNVVEYADRAMTFGVLVLVAATIGVWQFPRLDSSDRRSVLKGVAWLAGGFAVTIWLPVRSSLYVVFPSVGWAMATATIVAAAMRNAAPRTVMRLATAAVILPFALLPVYWSRNVRWTELRSLTTATIRAIEQQHLPTETLVVLEDDLSTRANFRNAFGPMFPEAAAVVFNNQLRLWIEPPPPEVTAPQPRVAGADRVAIFRLVGGRVERGPSVSPSARAGRSRLIE